MEVSKPKVMILGTFHLRPTPDLHRIDFDNVSNQKRQEEIRKVIEAIKRFKPTKLAFEIVKEKSHSLNKDFLAYLDGKFELTTNEVHQFGFTAAKELGHKEIFAVDWMESVGQRGYGDVIEWAQKEQPDLYQFISDTYFSKNVFELSNDSIFETIKMLNDDERIMTNHEVQMHIARIGKESEYVGIDWLRWWYQRNLIIYSNIVNLIESSNDRILLLIGGSHIYLIAQFLKESGLVDLEQAKKYLY